MWSVLWTLAGLQTATILIATVGSTDHIILGTGAVEVLSIYWILMRIRQAHGELEKKRLGMDQELSMHVTKQTVYLVELVEKYQHAAITDQLTGILNRRGGEDTITRRLSSARRAKKPMSFILADLDQFKLVNDKHGHAAGDTVLATVARTIVSQLRQADIAIRWGGEEILVALPDTNLNGALRVAEKLRQSIHSLDFGSFTVTSSFGVSEIRDGENFCNAFARADMQLYISKARGRNLVSPETGA